MGFELLFRVSADQTEACVTDDASATAGVVHHAFRAMGIRSVVGRAQAFVNVDAEWLLSGEAETLPADQVVLEVLETVDVDDEIVGRCRALKAKGYRLALDDFIRYSDTYEPLLVLVDIVKVDVLHLDPASLKNLVRRLKSWPVRLMAEKVDTLERAHRCLALGFDLFQGFFYGRPTVLSGH